jgi:acid phosphatase
MRLTHRGPIALCAAGALALGAPAVAAAHGPGHGDGDHHGKGLRGIQRIVVIYEENHSFDNLYGGWEGVNGLRRADPDHTRQVDQSGVPYACLLQNDVNLTTPPLGAACAANSNFFNRPFLIDAFIRPTDTTCPPLGDFSKPTGWLNGTGQPGGCTRDLVHRYYQEQYQLNGGRQNRYTTGSDAVGLTQGVYNTRALPIYTYLHERGHPDYAIADAFFQAAFGGSFLNHQWLIAAATPTWPDAVNDGSTANDQHSVVDANGMPVPGTPTNSTYPLYSSPSPTLVRDRALTASCMPPTTPTPPGVTCGDFAVNTIQPFVEPFSSPTAVKLPLQTAPTIGDRLSAKGIDWAWYSGGWSNANGDVDAPGWTNGHGPTCSDPNALPTATFPHCADKLFQFHHQPFNYFANYATGPARAAHLRDEAEFEAQAQASKGHCELKPVSIVKPIGAENEHPGYASETSGSSHLVELLTAIQNSSCAKDTMVVVTYDEFGGQWDHVSPPGLGGTGPHDQWGPSTRIPALVLAPGLRDDFVVDHTQYDTTSIMATIERRFGLPAVSSRDARVNDLSRVFKAQAPHGHRGHWDR